MWTEGSHQLSTSGPKCLVSGTEDMNIFMRISVSLTRMSFASPALVTSEFGLLLTLCEN